MRQNENIRIHAASKLSEYGFENSEIISGVSKLVTTREEVINLMIEFAQEQSQQSEPQHDLKTEIVLKELTDFADYVSRQRTNGHVYFKNGFNLANSVFCEKLIEILKKHKAPTKK